MANTPNETVMVAQDAARRYPRDMLRTSILLLALLLPGTAGAVECSAPVFTPQPGLAQTTASGTPRTPLLSDAPPCPNDTPACRLRATIVAGDPVVVGPAAGDYVCILFTGSPYGTVAFIRNDQLTPPRPLRTPPLSAWAGTWHQADNTIHLRVQGANLVADGDAYWPSSNPTLTQRPGGPNLGEMSGTAAPNGNVIIFAGRDAQDCTVTLTLVPPNLIALDNGNCGGNNVHFTGLFRQ